MIITSVIIPVYNAAAYLEETLKSVLAGADETVEVLAVDNGSTDSSLQILERFAKQHEALRILKTAPVGPGGARNLGLTQAKGEYICFVDSDDLIMPELFALCRERCEINQLDFVTYCSREFYSDDLPGEERYPRVYQRDQLALPRGICTGTDFWRRSIGIAGGIPFVCWLFYVRRSFLLTHDLTFAEDIYFEDNDWVLRLYARAKRMEFLPVVLHRYRLHPGSVVTGTALEQQLADSFTVCQRLTGLYEALPDRTAVLDVLRQNNHRISRLLQGAAQTEGMARTAAEFTAFLGKTLQPECEPELAGALMEVLTALRESCLSLHPQLCSLNRQLFEICKSYYGFWNKNNLIAIYGTGMRTRAFMQSLEQWPEPVCCRMCFLDSYAGAAGTWEGYPLYPVRLVGTLSPDRVIITSRKYQQEMMEQLCRYQTKPLRVIQM